MSRHHFTAQERAAYTRRMSLALVASLLLAIGAVRWWPAPYVDLSDRVFDTNAQELIQIEEIQQTQQRARRPPPPKPLTPVVRPDDIVLDEIEIELSDNLLTDDPGEEDVEEEEGLDAATSANSGRPDAGPRAVRVVEPEYTRDARRRNVRAEVIVEVLVNDRGRVESARVVDRFLLKGRDNEEREAVSEVGYGLEDAAIAAAQQWMFRPARESGRSVSSFTRLTFSFGI